MASCPSPRYDHVYRRPTRGLPFPDSYPGVGRSVTVYYIDSPKGCKFFGKVLSFYTHTLSVPPYQPLSTGSWSILEAGASRASPGISIGRTAIVVVRAPISGATSVSCFTGETSVLGIEPETWSQSFGHYTKALAVSFWTYIFRRVPNHQEPEKILRKNPLVLVGIRTWAIWWAVRHSTYWATLLL